MLSKLATLLLVAVLPISAQTILVHAHRGGRASRPENTIPAFEFAIKHKVDALELDLAVTKDNVLVVSHSPYLTQVESNESFYEGCACERAALRRSGVACRNPDPLTDAGGAEAV